MSNQNLLKVLFLLSCLCLSLPSFSAGKLGADMHQAKGVQCQTRHGTDMKNPQYPTEETCTQCHQKAVLAEKTRNLPGANPHAAPHNGDCILCHLQHEKSENYCAQCHNFKFVVP